MATTLSIAEVGSAGELLDTLDRHRPDSVVIDAALLRRLLVGGDDGPTAPAAPPLDAAADPGLTDRERSILAAISSGLTTAAISRQLWISEHTIKFHLTNIYRKLGVRNRAGAVRYALEHGLS